MPSLYRRRRTVREDGSRLHSTPEAPHRQRKKRKDKRTKANAHQRQHPVYRPVTRTPLRESVGRAVERRIVRNGRMVTVVVHGLDDGPTDEWKEAFRTAWVRGLKDK